MLLKMMIMEMMEIFIRSLGVVDYDDDDDGDDNGDGDNLHQVVGGGRPAGGVEKG